MRGQFRLWPGTPQEAVIPNNITDDGEEAFLRMIGQDHQGDVAAGDPYYVGLMGATYADNLTLSTLSGEPSVTNNYARAAVNRNSTGWPTIAEVNGIKLIRTALITFTASGGDYSASIRRLFLCNVASGTSGKLFSVSGLAASAILVTPTSPLPVYYELMLR